LVSIEVTSRDVLFDIKIEILEEYLAVSPGEKILASVTIFSLGREGRVDTEIKYQIKSRDGKSILEKEEVIAVDVETSILREFFIPSDAEPGDYILYASVKYNGQIGSASQWFEVVQPGGREKNITLWIFLGILVVLVILFISKSRFGRKEKVTKSRKPTRIKRRKN